MITNKYDTITDNELLERFYADKNNEWLGILLQRYTILLLGVCMKYLKNEEEAKDGVQQVFLKAINELQKYKVEYFKSWLYMVAKNHCLMKLRDKGKYTTELNEQFIATPYEAEDKNEYIVKDKALDNMAMALQQLNTEQQQCITLFYLQKKSYQEITEQTSYTLLQVKSHIQNGKRNLKLIMERLQQNER
ncbi:MAG: sigma-70 family RNA polymerase sigma factor [Chitinophagaceae bacterium]|nr:sigma-70 family RNA polymerase sigma factor [Chitinophagaceae bacterium]